MSEPVPSAVGTPFLDRLIASDCLGPTEWAKLLDRHVNTIRRWVRRGECGVKLRAVYLGRRLCIGRVDVEAFLVELEKAKRERGGQPPAAAEPPTAKAKRANAEARRRGLAA